jgi:hypothetical protein
LRLEGTSIKATMSLSTAISYLFNLSAISIS